MSMMIIEIVEEKTVEPASTDQIPSRQIACSSHARMHAHYCQLAPARPGQGRAHRGAPLASAACGR